MDAPEDVSLLGLQACAAWRVVRRVVPWLRRCWLMMVNNYLIIGKTGTTSYWWVIADRSASPADLDALGGLVLLESATETMLQFYIP